jgi:hypothetical protein
MTTVLISSIKIATVTNALIYSLTIYTKKTI